MGGWDGGVCELKRSDKAVVLSGWIGQEAWEALRWDVVVAWGRMGRVSGGGAGGGALKDLTGSNVFPHDDLLGSQERMGGGKASPHPIPSPHHPSPLDRPPPLTPTVDRRNPSPPKGPNRNEAPFPSPVFPAPWVVPGGPPRPCLAALLHDHITSFLPLQSSLMIKSSTLSLSSLITVFPFPYAPG